MECIESPQTLCSSPPPAHPASLTINLLHQNGSFFVSDEPTLTCYQPRPIVYIRGSLCVLYILWVLTDV